MGKKNWIGIRIAARFNLPGGRRLSPATRAAVQKLVTAAMEIDALAVGGGFVADESLLVDFADALQTMASIGKRARAVSGGT